MPNRTIFFIVEDWSNPHQPLAVLSAWNDADWARNEVVRLQSLHRPAHEQFRTPEYRVVSLALNVPGREVVNR